MVLTFGLVSFLVKPFQSIPKPERRRLYLCGVTCCCALGLIDQLALCVRHFRDVPQETRRKR